MVYLILIYIFIIYIILIKRESDQKIPSNIYFILSCLPNDNNYKYDCDLRLKSLNIPIMYINNLDNNDGICIINLYYFHSIL